ncbi:hypothetical protein [Corynebacterium freiburgense]|uniref:hypothetical protein n=1 Tax=Corynebacterium freiburgense TaxID=556548 RepID=UPI00041C6DCC|nr:hypothetical protein [Corynebacterium freiburgense]WJZ01372.1 hypothetical protein CFREI_00275 [Corynebacterium freiburgense]
MISTHGAQANGVYEQWVLTIREWAEDSTVSLALLPPLTDESFNPPTFKRLLKHIDRALSAVDTRWNESLQKALSTANSLHEFELALVQSRALLARRIQLCKHPSLPDVIRTSLLQDARAKIQDWQNQLETSVARASSRSSIDNREREQLLNLVRKSPLTAVLDEDFQTSNSLFKVIDQQSS